MRVETQGPAETEMEASRLAARLVPGDVVLVSGELGAGKTTFIRGACRGLGVREPVTSPTFTIGQLYAGERDGQPLEVAHLDLYRLSSPDDADPGLLDDYLTPERIAFVEWPAVGRPLIERVAAAVELAHAGENRRAIEVRAG